MRFKIAVLLSVAVFTGNAVGQPSAVKTVEKAFMRYLFDDLNSPIYDLPKGSPIVIGIKIEKDSVYIAMPDVIYAQDPTQGRMNNFFSGLMIRGDSDAVITDAIGYSTSYSSGPVYDKLIQPFKAGGVVADTIVIPTDWKPVFDPFTPQKERMLKGIVISLEKQISWDLSHLYPSKPLPRKLKLIIYNFNFDSWYTYALLEPSNDLWYSIELHDIDNHYEDEYEENGEYGCITGGLETIPGGWKSTIMKYGIVREIDLRR